MSVLVLLVVLFLSNGQTQTQAFEYPVSTSNPAVSEQTCMDNAAEIRTELLGAKSKEDPSVTVVDAEAACFSVEQKNHI